jgi:hypothetical protein
MTVALLPRGCNAIKENKEEYIVKLLLVVN